MHFYALVEKGSNESRIYFRNLPGCISTATTPSEALQKTPTIIANYLRWIKQNDIILFEEDPTSIDVVPKELLESSDGSGEPIFKADLVASDDMEITNTLNVAATMRALIIELVTDMPSAHLSRTTDAGDWSLARHLTHVMETETWYVAHLQEHPTAMAALDPTMSIDDLCMKFFENAMDYELVLRDLPPEQRTRIFVHEGEAWTLAKVLRRMTGHLSEHYAQMQALVH